MKINFNPILILWGEKHTNLFLNYSLPSLLAEGNLKFLPQIQGSHKLWIYTTSKSLNQIIKSPNFAKIGKKIEVMFFTIEEPHYKKPKVTEQDVVSFFQGDAIKRINDRNNEEDAILPLQADLIFSKNSFKRLFEIASKGYRMILARGWRVIDYEIIPRLHKFYDKKDSLSISHRELVELACKYLHPTEAIHLRNFPNSNLHGSPTYIDWAIPTQGILSRTGIAHPLLIMPVQKEEIFSYYRRKGIDSQDYLERTVPDFDEVYMIQDSDELFFVAPTPIEGSSIPTYDFSLSAAWFAQTHLNWNYGLYDKKIYVHWNDIDKKSVEWKKAIKKTDIYIKYLIKAAYSMKHHEGIIRKEFKEIE